MTPDTSVRSRPQASSAAPIRSSPSIPDAAYGAVLAALAAIVGAVGWSGQVLALPLAMAFPALWALAPSRVAAAMVSGAYFLAASRGLPQGVATFYGAGMGWGLALWIAASLAFVAVHALLWTGQPGAARAARYAVAAVLMAVPPFGIVGWAHPVTSAGALFPGWGWIGLLAAAGVVLAMTTRRWPVAVLMVGGLWIWSAATWTPPPVADRWTGIDTQLGRDLGRQAGLDPHRLLLGEVGRAAAAGHGVIVLPESALGVWTPTVARFWESSVRDLGVVVVAGAFVIDRAGYDNVLVEVAGGTSRVLYRERMPVPVSMWQPWRAWFGGTGSARAHVFANPIVTVGDRRVAPLICYEQLIVWPVIQSMAHAPDVIVAVGNGWWTAGTAIVAIQRASTQAWARLFNRPLVPAFNL